MYLYGRQLIYNQTDLLHAQSEKYLTKFSPGEILDSHVVYCKFLHKSQKLI